MLLHVGAPVGYAQSSQRVDKVPAEGIPLSRGWLYYPGDLPNGADPRLDDRRWEPIDPSQQMAKLPQLRRNRIGWLRLHLTTGDSLPPVLLHVFQSVASELYLDGRLLYRFGTVSSTPDSVRALNPTAGYVLPIRPGADHLIALRVAPQPGLDYVKNYSRWDAAAVQLMLFPSTGMPAPKLLSLRAIFFDAFKFGIAFILCILHLSLYIAYRKQPANLYAALLYLWMFLAYFSKASLEYVHPQDHRMVLYYGVILDGFVPIITLLILYTLFNVPKKWPFWLSVATVVIRLFYMPTPYEWLNWLLIYFLALESVRIALIATRQKQLGAQTVLVGVLCSLGLWITYSILGKMNIRASDNEWLFHGLYLASFLAIPLTFSLRLALEHGWTNRELMAQLREVKELSAKNLAQQQEQQEFLARQNEQLEQQVAERTQELRQQADQLAELNQTRSRFVTNLTHEFRTPLSLILSPAQKLLESPTLPTTVRTALRTIDRNARHLLRQVNQLLDLARLEDNRMQLSPQNLHIDKLTRQLVELFESSAREKQITLRFRAVGDTNESLIDADKWGKIVYNLLANAIKFTPPGGQVDVEYGQTADEIAFAVHDTGIGIAAEKLPFVFDRFYQVDDALTRSFEGTGVGLSLVRELTQLMGGTVHVTSQPGEGSVFTVTLPRQHPIAGIESQPESDLLPVAVRAPISEQPEPESEVSAPASVDDQTLVLVVEDNAELRSFMVDELASRYRVLAAANGAEGWEAARQHLPDVVITDVMMPQMDGFQLTKRIKTTPATDHVAVVMLTARSTHESRLDGLKYGADDYLTKPVDLNELRLRVGNLIAHRQKLRDFFRKQVQTVLDEKQPVAALVDDPFLARVYSLLESHLDNSKLKVEWLADQLAMDRKTLYRKLQSKIQLKPNELIRSYRLRRAGELLRQGNSVTDTAFRVGFESVAYFSQCFKEQYQMTPTEFIGQEVQ